MSELAPSGSLRIWLDGRLYADPAEALLSATDHGVVVGNGIFETLKVTAAGAFAVSRHLRRLTRSARAMRLPEPDYGVIRDGIAAVIDGRQYPYGRLRITYTGGLGPLSSKAPYGPPTIVIAADATEPPPEATDIVTAPWIRNERGALTGVKSTSYAENVRALADATDRGATEAVFVNGAGNLCEGSGSNLFFVFGSDVVTPPLAAGPLAGITRELLLEWWSIAETDVTPAEAARADEVFLTSSLRDVQAVRRWDAHVREAPGVQTASLAKVFAERADENLDP
jgi:branched-chain amino acid aminotransferase